MRRYQTDKWKYWNWYDEARGWNWKLHQITTPNGIEKKGEKKNDFMVFSLRLISQQTLLFLLLHNEFNSFSLCFYFYDKK